MFHSNSPNRSSVSLPGATKRTWVPERIVSSGTPPITRRTALASPTSFAYDMAPLNHERHARVYRVPCPSYAALPRSLLPAESEVNEAQEGSGPELLVDSRQWVVRRRGRQNGHRRSQRGGQDRPVARAPDGEPAARSQARARSAAGLPALALPRDRRGPCRAVRRRRRDRRVRPRGLRPGGARRVRISPRDRTGTAPAALLRRLPAVLVR